MKIIMPPVKHVAIAVAALLMILFAGCKSYFVAADFDTRTVHHKTVAILPFEMIFTGVRPEQLTDEDLQWMAEAESKAFMISFYNEVLSSTRGGRKPIRVDVQHFDKTLSILNANNIGIRLAWIEDPGKLAKILGVDAVVKARIEKRRFMSDLTSFGIDLGVHILAVLSDNNIWFWLPADLTRSKEVLTSYALVDREGSTLWSIAYNIEANWRMPANEIIDGINRKSAKRFPYRR